MGDETGQTQTERRDSEFANVFTVSNGELLTWCVNLSDPVRFSFPNESRFRGWSVLSPIAVPDDAAPPQVVGLKDGRFLVMTDMLSFEVSPECVPEPSEEMEVADRIVRWLRLVTGHAELAAELRVVHKPKRVVRGQLPAGAFTGRPLNDVEKNAIMFECMASAARLHPTCEVPTYTEILHDAIEAHAVEDCRKSILYAAIAVEEMAATRLEEIFALRAAETPQRFRIVERHGSGNTVQKDPVFEYLQQNAKRDSRLLFDALPAYVFGRSMIDDRNQLHTELSNLRDARNGLAHRPGKASSKGLPIDDEGAHRALHAAIGAFEWFEAPGRFPVTPPTLARTQRIANQRLRRR